MNDDILKLPLPKFTPIKKKREGKEKPPKIYAYLDDLLTMEFYHEYFNKK